MLERITHRAFFGDANYPFALSDGMLAELKQITGKGASAVYVQLANLTYTAATLREIIRLGLIGAGMSPKEAKRPKRSGPRLKRRIGLTRRRRRTRADKDTADRGRTTPRPRQSAIRPAYPSNLIK